MKDDCLKSMIKIMINTIRKYQMECDILNKCITIVANSINPLMENWNLSKWKQQTNQTVLSIMKVVQKRKENTQVPFKNL